ncbi:hypothetical protein D3C86_1837740 [compost metagenome]
MKSIVRSVFMYYFVGAALTGSLYKLIYNPEDESILKLLIVNIVMLAIAYVFSYFGYLADKKKNNDTH